MALDILRERGIPLDRQSFNWRDLVQVPFSKLDDDAFTRVRVILMNGIELESVLFLHSFARMNRDLRRVLAQVRRVDHHQTTVVNWLNPPDQSPLETTIGYEQVAVFEGGPTRADLEAIRDDELRHFALLKRAMERLEQARAGRARRAHPPQRAA
ncbi:hypothetical protein WMF41_39960 [Sorangium sp. So ce1151]